MNISLLLRLFSKKPKTEENIQGSCQRCMSSIEPYCNCCILGYDTKKGYHPRLECNEIICYKCAKFLGFEINAIHVSNSHAQPVIFFSKKYIEECQAIAAKIHKSSMVRKLKNKQRKKHRK